jgi:hypothetical protein
MAKIHAPTPASPIEDPTLEEMALARAIGWITAGRKFTIETLASSLGYSAGHLRRLPRLINFLRAFRDDRRRVRGWKNTDGSIEAWREDEPEADLDAEG